MWYMNDERRQLQKMARDFAVSEVRPFIKEMEEKEAFPFGILKKAGELGMLGLLFSEEVGGSGPNWVDMGLVIEEVGKESFTVANTLASVYAGSSSLNSMGSGELKEKFLTPVIEGDMVIASGMCEPVGVARFHDYQTKITQDGDECVINGGKIFCTNAGNADVYNVIANSSESGDVLHDGIAICIVPKDTPGLKIGHIENKLGLHGSSTGQLYFNNCRIPKENILASFPIDFNSMMAGGYEIAVLIGVGCLGAAEGVYEKTLNFCREKKHGDTSLYDSYQVLRHQLADLWMEIEAYRSFVFSAMDAMDRGENVSAQAWACKVKGSQMFERVASQCVMLNGGNGVVVENDIERYYRDAKMTSVAGFALPHIIDIITMLI